MTVRNLLLDTVALTLLSIVDPQLDAGFATLGKKAAAFVEEEAID